VRYAERIACQVAKRRGYSKEDIEDLISVARLAAVEAVMRNGLGDSKLRAYIVQYVNGRIKDHISKRPTVPVPRYEIRKEILRAQEAKEEPDFDRLIPHAENILNTKYHMFTKLDYEDLFKHYKMSKVEIDIIKMRIQGYTYCEINNFFKKSHGWCNYMLRKLREKIERNNDGVRSHAKNEK